MSENDKSTEIVTSATLHTEVSKEDIKHRDSLDPNTTSYSSVVTNKYVDYSKILS